MGFTVAPLPGGRAVRGRPSFAGLNSPDPSPHAPRTDGRQQGEVRGYPDEPNATRE
jgi:hypothetical protein